MTRAAERLAKPHLPSWRPSTRSGRGEPAEPRGGTEAPASLGATRFRLELAAAVLLVASLAACTASLAPAPVVTVPRHPDYVFPATPPELASRDLSLRQQRGWQFLQAGDTRGARREFTAALKINAAFYPAEAGLGYASLADRDYPDATVRFERALKRAPAYVPALVGRGDTLVAAGRMDEGARSLQAALAADPSLADVKRRLEVIVLRRQQETLAQARQATEAGRFDEAAQAYERAIALSPDSAFLYRELASVERKQGKLPAALGHLKKAVATDPSDARAWVQMGDVLEEQGEHAAAVEAYTRAQTIEPGEETAARLVRARAGAELARLPEAYRAIATAPQVTRGDLAAVIGVRLAPLLASAPTQQAVVLTDVRSHWAATWIMAVVKAGVMEAFPNHTFQPRSVVHRLEMARVLSRVLGLVADERPALARKWEDARPRIADLPAAHMGYPAAAAVVASGVMSLSDGLFRPGRVVSGAEAVEAVGRIEGLMR